MSTISLDEHNLKFFILIALPACGALPLGKYFTESKISKTVSFRVFSSLHIHEVPRSWTVAPGKIRTKRLKLYLLTHLYGKI